MDGPREQACPNCARLEREVTELKARVAQREGLLEQALRVEKRQAAPVPKKSPQTPGR